MTEKELDAIRARERAALPGPWFWQRGRHHGPLDARTGGALRTTKPFTLGGEEFNQVLICTMQLVEGVPALEFFGQPGDIAFIAHAREDVPALLAEIDRLRAAWPAGEKGRRHGR
jgi:hypothetical protein